MITTPLELTCIVEFAQSVRALGSRPIVIKLGGSAMEDPGCTRGTLLSVVTLQSFGVPIVLVHGGGKPIDRAMAEAGLTPVKVHGRRFTDAPTLEIVVKVLCEELNPSVLNLIQTLGGQATGFTSPDDFPVQGEQLFLPGLDLQPIDLGYVGKPTHVDADRLNEVLKAGRIPVLPSLATRPDGGWLNVNADTVASAVAGSLGAARVMFLTDTPGILSNYPDPESLVRQTTEAECREWIASGVVSDGMVPKVEACFEALAAGAGSAQILDGRRPFAILEALLNQPPSGTLVTRAATN